MSPKFRPPSIDSTDFNCPHCGALTQQDWYSGYAKQIWYDDPTLRKPHPWTEQAFQLLVKDTNEELEYEKELQIKREISGHVEIIKGDSQYALEVSNVFLSRCYNCHHVGIWVSNKLMYPKTDYHTVPDEGMPINIKRDFTEAQTIVNESPRGACALLRLCIQKICTELGEPGKNLNSDIASLVAKGLSPVIQKSLDYVRVVGNNAVHPGVIDVSDDVAMAIKLFELVNLICRTMITDPKKISDLYDTLPPEARDAIDNRDKS